MTEKMIDTLIKIAAKKGNGGCRLSITSPGGRHLDTIQVTKVYDNGTIAGHSEEVGTDTAYYITDGINVRILNENLKFK